MLCKNGQVIGCNGSCSGKNKIAVRIEGEAECTARRIKYDWPIYIVSQVAVHENNLHIDPDCIIRGRNYVELTEDVAEANPEVVDALINIAKELKLKVTRNPEPDSTICEKSGN